MYPPNEEDKEIRKQNLLWNYLRYLLLFVLRLELVVNCLEGIFGQFERIYLSDVDCVKRLSHDDTRSRSINLN